MTFYRHSHREKFENPLPVPCKIAVVAPNFVEKEGVRSFDEDQANEIGKYRPDILAGAVPALLRLAQTIKISRAIVAFSGARVGPLSDRDRDLLWSAFRVPLFEHRFSPAGSVMARECEAHDGLHLYLPEHYQGALRTEACACGRPEPRI